MMSKRKVQSALLLAHDDGLIEDEEFLLLYDIKKPQNLELPY